MAVYDLEEQEQLDELKTWWKQYGNLVTAIAMAVSVAVVGWQGWNWWQRNQSAQASAIYSAVEQASAQQDAKRVRELAGELIDKFSGTAYAGMAALLSARAQVEAGDAKGARLQLAWAAENARDEAMRDLARLRLAAVMLDEKAHDEALKQLAAEPAAAFAPRYAELRGDILSAQGKKAEAKAAYETALAKLDALEKSGGGNLHGPYRDMLRAKGDSAGAAK